MATTAMNRVRRVCRQVHRHLSYFFTGMLAVYALSGIALNHKATLNTNYRVERIETRLDGYLPPASAMDREAVCSLLARIDPQAGYVKHYFPEAGQLRVFLRGGSNLWIDLGTGQAVYERLTPRPVISALARLHYNPGRWWTAWADAFGIGLLLIALSGIVLLKGRSGLWGIGGVELLAGIAVPLLFLLM